MDNHQEEKSLAEDQQHEAAVTLFYPFNIPAIEEVPFDFRAPAIFAGTEVDSVNLLHAQQETKKLDHGKANIANNTILARSSERAALVSHVHASAAAGVHARHAGNDNRVSLEQILQEIRANNQIFFDSISETLAGVETAVTANSTTIASYSTAITEMNTTIAANSAAITEMNTTMAANSTAITEMNTTLTEMNTTIAAHSGAITEMNTKMAANSIAITEMNTTIPANSTAIADNSTAIAA